MLADTRDALREWGRRLGYYGNNFRPLIKYKKPRPKLLLRISTVTSGPWGSHDKLPLKTLDRRRFGGLIHWDLNKMAAILQTTLLNAFFGRENGCIFIRISLKFVPREVVNNNPVSIQIMHSAEQVISPYLNQWWPDAYMYHSASVS